MEEYYLFNSRLDTTTNHVRENTYFSVFVYNVCKIKVYVKKTTIRNL